MNWLDPIGAGLCLICTYYFTKANRIAWLVGILASCINLTLYWQKGIYAHLLLESFFFITMVYGWLQWSNHNIDKANLRIRYLSLKETLFYFACAITGTTILANLLITYTDSQIPYWDATTTILSFLAQWLLCRKVINSWFIWFIVDAMIAVSQMYREIPFHSALYWLYLLMATFGYFHWRRLYNSQQPPKTDELPFIYLDPLLKGSKITS